MHDSMGKNHYISNYLCLLIIVYCCLVPNISPRIDIGGYDSIPNPELESKRDIFIYWEAIKRNKTCGGGQFQYQAFYEVVTKGNKIKLVTIICPTIINDNYTLPVLELGGL